MHILNRHIITVKQMTYTKLYKSPIGNLIIEADEYGLTRLWLNEQKYLEHNKKLAETNLPVFDDTEKWLDIYFSGKEPHFTLPLHFSGTEFEKQVFEILCTIPYGKTITYGEIATTIAVKRGIKRMSAQAVGRATGKNKFPIIVPCHRVIGKNGNLTGYSGGIDIKIELLKLEGVAIF